MNDLKLLASLCILFIGAAFVYTIIRVIKEYCDETMRSRVRDGDVCVNCHKRLRFLDSHKISPFKDERLCGECYEIYIDKLSNRKDI